MQDAGGKEDAELSEDNEMLGWRDWRVESLDTVSLLENSLLFAGYFRLPAAGLSAKVFAAPHQIRVATDAKSI